jgi:outer membrane protein TolC
MRAPPVGCRAASVVAAGLATGLVLLTPTPAEAQGDTLVITLADAYEIAERHNPTYQRSVNDLALEGPENRNTWFTQVVPQARVNLLSTSYNGNLRRQSTDFFGNPIPNPIDEWSFSSSTSQFLTLSWSIQGRDFLNALSRQKVNDQDRDLGADAARLALRSNVRRQYFDILQQQELLAVDVATLVARERDLESTQRLFGLARTTRVDVLNAELAIEQQNLTIQQQRRQYEQRLLTLATNLGDPDLPAIRLAPEPVVVFDPTELDDSGLVSRALEAHPAVRQAESALQGARLGVKESRESRWPTLSLQYQLGRQAQTREARALFDVTHQPDDLNNQFFIALSVPYLNNFFGNRLNEARADVQLDNQEEALKQARLEAERSVRSELINLRNQYENLRIAQRTLEIADEALRLAREEYRIGTRTFEQLQSDIQQEVTARRSVIQARYAFANAHANLEEAAGVAVAGQPPVADGLSIGANRGR